MSYDPLFFKVLHPNKPKTNLTSQKSLHSNFIVKWPLKPYGGQSRFNNLIDVTVVKRKRLEHCARLCENEGQTKNRKTRSAI